MLAAPSAAAVADALPATPKRSKENSKEQVDQPGAETDYRTHKPDQVANIVFGQSRSGLLLLNLPDDLIEKCRITLRDQDRNDPENDRPDERTDPGNAPASVPLPIPAVGPLQRTPI